MMSARTYRVSAPFFCFAFCILGFVSAAACAATYTFSGSSYPSCSNGSWSVSGTTHTCNGEFSLANGDAIVSATAITVVAKAGITLAGNNTIGSASVPVNLQTEWGNIDADANGKTYTFYGNLTTGSGSLSLANATVNGSLAAGSGSITLNKVSVSGSITASSGNISATSLTLAGSITTNGWVSLSAGSVAGNVTGNNGVTTTDGTTFGGNVTASSGSISLSGGSVVGSVHSDCCTITATNTDIGGNLSTTVISSNSNTVTIIGGTVSGTISTSGGNGIVIKNATVTSGSISATNVAISISNSTIGSAGSTVNITGNNVVTLSNNTTVYGNVTAGNWSSALTIDSSSIVYGVCTSNSNSVSSPPQYPRCASAASLVDHIALEVSGTPLTCTPATVTVKACANAACSTLTTASVNVTLTASNGGIWATSPLTVTGSATTTLRKTTTGTTTLTASGGSGTTTCTVNGVLQGSCQVSFADSALLLSVPTQTAGVTGSGSSALTVSAVRQSNNSLDCVPAFANVTRSVKFWSAYVSPDSGTKTLAVGGTSIAGATTTLAASTSSTGTALALTFDATGKATATLKYDDAGQLALRARYDGSAANSDASLLLTGENTLLSVPYGLCVDSSDSGWNCVAGDATCAKYRKAGEAFKLRVTGKAYQSGAALCAMPTTANYRQNDIALSAKVVAPSGGENGTLGTSTISVTADGTATISDQTHSEVGVFTFTATPPSKAYFGLTVAPGTSANFGRFIPDHFAITAGTVEPACSTFTYFGEDGITTPFTLTAQNSASATTSNYRGDFAKFTPTLWSAYGFATAAALPDGSTLAASSTAPTGSWVKGGASVSAKHQISRPSALSAETSVKLTALPKDSDGVTMASATAVHSAATPLRYGRLRLSNAFGPDRRDLSLPVEAQYWSGLSWVRNAADSCTTLPVAAISLSGAKGNTKVASEVQLSSGGGSLVLSCPYATCPLSSKPATSLAGSVGVCVDLGADPASGVDCDATEPAAKPYLQGKWPPGSGYDNDPSARATFGVYSPETRRTVHIRELF